MNVKFPVFFLIFIVFAVLVVYVVISIPQEPEQEAEPEKKECNEGETRNCMRGPCEGIKKCINGTWGSCIIERICEPGEVVPCIINHCASAYKVCNDCGTGYGPCTGRN